uniref:Uncharacterized protein n=1 Tax=Romanomermis culicivorax TaxID=13658 RepID=A0A915KEA5_ROMCU
MKKAGLYEKCQRCPLLDAYKNEEIEELEMVHKQTTSKQYHNNMLNIIEFCCSKEKAYETMLKLLSYPFYVYRKATPSRHNIAKQFVAFYTLLNHKF